MSDLFEGQRTPLTISDTLNRDFDDLREFLSRRKVQIPITERDEWEQYFNTRKAEVQALSAHIVDAETEINERVYRLFELSRDEIALIEDTIAGQY